MSFESERKHRNDQFEAEMTKRNEATKVWIQAETQTRQYAIKLERALEKILRGRFHIGNDENGNMYGPPDAVMCRKIAEEALKKDGSIP